MFEFWIMPYEKFVYGCQIFIVNKCLLSVITMSLFVISLSVVV